ncbi:MAG: hypothetical protein ACLRH4_16330 [Anaerobutyricum hallii]|uniref:Uncharacterized protein n=1 Tax=Anaerovorax odorimutans TaxID=109327 RepID=A0ABT1RTN3_9FIRM|nr:hypothetical protein [Anaerovorax odorimutans]MCQ4638564.1 hypothetical protein [Anaerovorax odorimutans]
MLKDEKLEVIKKEFDQKNMILAQFGECVDGITLYEDVFEDTALVMPVVFIDEDETKHMVKMSIAEAMEQAKDRNDVLLGGSTYFKEFISKETAKDICAFIIDMDNVWAGVLLSALQNDWNTDKEELPKPTYIVNSGTGLHLYFVFDEPIPHYYCNAEIVDRLYRALAVQQTTKRIYLYKQVQWFGQDFRMAGGLNKYNWRNEVFRVGEKWDIDELARAVGMNNTHFVRYGESRQKQLTQRDRTKNRPKRKGWRCNRGFYDYTFERCWNETKEGTRYMSMCALTVIAWKCNVSLDEVERDLLSLIPKYNEGATRKIKENEVNHALRMYNEKAMLTQRERLEAWVGWGYKPIKRKGRQQDVHLERARAVQAIDYPDGSWRNKEGRPSKQKIVEKWRWDHLNDPTITKADCIRETGLDKKTVYKWWKIFDENLKSLLGN